MNRERQPALYLSVSCFFDYMYQKRPRPLKNMPPLR
jgi:hypothetical protein